MKILKTAIVYSDQENCKLCLGDGDWREFDKVWCNSGRNPKKELMLGSKLYNDNGDFMLRKVTNKEFEDEIKDGAPVILCGFLL